MHMLLHGLLMELLTELLGPGRDTQWLQPDTLKLISKRSEGIHRVAEVGRRYRDVAKYVHNWTMSELLGWAEFYSKPVLYDIVLGRPENCSDELRQRLTRRIAFLHVAILWFCRPNTETGPAYQTTLRIMSQYIWEYAECIEATYGAKLLRLNLHQAACHLQQQCLHRGHIGNEGELFIERGV